MVLDARDVRRRRVPAAPRSGSRARRTGKSRTGRRPVTSRSTPWASTGTLIPAAAACPRSRRRAGRRPRASPRPARAQLEAQDDVEVVRRLVGVDPDQRALDGVDRAIEGVGVDLAERGPELPSQHRQHPAAERARAADDVLPQPALGLVDAERDRLAERAARELGRDLRLVEAVAELMQGGEVRDAEVVQVVARGDAHVRRAERLGERVRRGVQPPAVGVEADRLEHVHDRAALVVDLEGAREDAVVAGVRAGAGGRGDELDQRVAQRLEQRPQLGGRQAGLEVVEQQVVGVLDGLEARDVAVAQLDVAGERVAEQREVRRRARLLPGLLAQRVGVAHLGGELRGHADRLLVIALDRGEQAHVVGVRVLPLGRRRERVEQAPDLGVGELAVADELERGGVVGAGGGAARRHHRVLVPEQHRVDAAEVGQLGHPLPEGGELGGSAAHGPASA